MRKDKQLFRELTLPQLEAIIEGLDLLLDKQLQKDLSVLDVRPIYLLKRKAQEEASLKNDQVQEDLQQQRKVIRAYEDLLHEEPADA